MNSKSDKLIRAIKKYLVAGVILYGLSIATNYFLVTIIKLDKPIAYAFTLIIELFLGFILNEFFVYESKQKKHKKKLFVLVAVSFRLINWSLYTFLIGFLHTNYLYIQLALIGIFAIIKFNIYKKIFE